MGLIRQENVGSAYIGDSLDARQALAVALCDNVARRAAMCEKASTLADSLYSARTAVWQIVSALSARP